MEDKNILKKLDSIDAFKYFAQICEIPHASYNCNAICGYIVNFAVNNSLNYYRDDHSNIVITSEASEGYEDAPGVILQAHLDMVADKEQECVHDFNKDTIKLKVEGDFISAKGTTLGADDGSGVALILALLADRSLKHPRLEALFTTDEEVGMLGAAGGDFHFLKGEYLINIDSEKEGVLTLGCAGGSRMKGIIKLHSSSVSGAVCEIRISGLKGGHSGMEIDKERANAIKLMGRVLYDIGHNTGFRIVDIESSGRDNAIPNACTSRIIIEPDNAEKIPEIIEETQKRFLTEYAVSDPEISIKMNVVLKGNGGTEINAVSSSDSKKLVFYLMCAPSGIINMDQVLKKQVETSLNLSSVKIRDSVFTAVYLIRSSVPERTRSVIDMLNVFHEYLDGEVKIENSYPGWKPVYDSVLVLLMKKIYNELFSSQMTVETTHAGLECGYIMEKSNIREGVSIGPDLESVHTVNEKMSISSMERTYKYLFEVLKNIR